MSALAAPLPSANEYIAWETQPKRSDKQAAMEARTDRASKILEQAYARAAGTEVSSMANDASFGGDTSALIEQIMMEQMGKTANVMQGTYYSEKLAVDCDVPDEVGGSLSIMQDPGAEQRGHGEAGGIVWKCAATMAYHLCDRTYFPAGYWQGKRCLEIGAGTGILGLAAARLGALVTITDYGELSELIQHNVKRNLNEAQAAVTKVDSFDWNNPRTKLRFPPEAWDVILISDVVWADGYGRLPLCLTEIALPTTPIVLGFEQRAHKRPELASPTFIPTLRKTFDVQDVEFPEEFRREHLHLFHLYNTK